VSKSVVSTVAFSPLLLEDDFLLLHELRFHATGHTRRIDVRPPDHSLLLGAQQQHTVTLHNIIDLNNNQQPTKKTEREKKKKIK
jgi:hypothetical protein